MKKCERCGYNNKDEADFCNLCTNRLPKFAPLPPQRGKPDDMAMYERRVFKPGGGSQTERHFMVPPTGAPVKLEPGKALVVGRDETCAIRIATPKVSRKHGEIKLDGNPLKLVYTDLGSANGSYVNGEKLAPNATRVLVDQDLLEVGGIGNTYRVLAPGQSEDLLKKVGDSVTLADEPAPVAIPMPVEDDAAIVGNAAILPLGEVLARLKSLKANGVLIVEAGGQKGALRIEGGVAAAGSFAGLEGEPATTAVAALKTGRFRFEESPQLMEVAVEESAAAPEAPAPAPAAPAPAPAAPRPPAAKPPGAPRPATGKPGAPPPGPGGPRPGPGKPPAPGGPRPPTGRPGGPAPGRPSPPSS